MNDKELYQLCKKFGREALQARRKFAGLLPEVFKRQLYAKKGYSSIYHFAAKLAGMSREQVAVVLKLDRQFEDRPILQKALMEGKINEGHAKAILAIENPEKNHAIKSADFQAD